MLDEQKKEKMRKVFPCTVGIKRKKDSFIHFLGIVVVDIKIFLMFAITT